MMRTYYNNNKWRKNKIKLIIEDEKGRFATDILLNTTKEDIYHKKNHHVPIRWLEHFKFDQISFLHAN